MIRECENRGPSHCHTAGRREWSYPINLQPKDPQDHIDTNYGDRQTYAHIIQHVITIFPLTLSWYIRHNFKNINNQLNRKFIYNIHNVTISDESLIQ